MVGKSLGMLLVISLLTGMCSFFCWLLDIRSANCVGKFLGTLLVISLLTGLGLVWLSWG